MSNKSEKNARKRPYTQRARARRREAIHLRITKAAVDLHGSVGPARTTVSDIAKLAGVRRATVYNHFPTDRQLFDACSSHWFNENPPPDPNTWAAIPEPAERLRIALGALYEYYNRGRDMLGKVLRDGSQVPALQEILIQKWLPLLTLMIDVLSRGWNDEDGESDSDHITRLHASFRVVLDFFTWQTLSSSGLSVKQAADLAASWIVPGGTAARDLDSDGTI